jgi:hypothetical protein
LFAAECSVWRYDRELAAQIRRLRLRIESPVLASVIDRVKHVEIEDGHDGFYYGPGAGGGRLCIDLVLRGEDGVKLGRVVATRILDHNTQPEDEEPSQQPQQGA